MHEKNTHGLKSIPRPTQLSQGRHRRPLRFTIDEDDFLKRVIDKHGVGQWTAIFRDPGFRFQKGRLADSLKENGRRENNF